MGSIRYVVEPWKLRKFVKKSVWLSCTLNALEAVEFWCEYLQKHCNVAEGMQNICLTVSCEIVNVPLFKHLLDPKLKLKLDPWFQCARGAWQTPNALISICSSRWTSYAWFQKLHNSIGSSPSNESGSYLGSELLWSARKLRKRLSAVELDSVLTPEELTKVKLQHTNAISEIIKILLTQHNGRFHVNDSDAIGYHTAISSAFFYGNIEIIELLIANDAVLFGNARMSRNLLDTVLWGSYCFKIPRKNAPFEEIKLLLSAIHSKYCASADYYIRMLINSTENGVSVFRNYLSSMDPEIWRLFAPDKFTTD